MEVKAKRSGKLLILPALVLPCRGDQPAAKASLVKFCVDTGASRTYIRRQAVRGVEVRATKEIGGITGGTASVTPFRAHLVFLPEGGDPHLVTAGVFLLDVPCDKEDGVLGLDLVRSLEFHDGEAEVGLATSDADLGGALARAVAGLKEVVGLEECGCRDVLAPAFAADLKRTNKDRLATRDRYERRVAFPVKKAEKGTIKDSLAALHEQWVASPGEKKNWWDV